MIDDWTLLAQRLATIIVIFFFVILLLIWNKDFTLDFLIYVGIFAIVAISLNLESGYTGLTNFGVVAFFAVGAYSSLLFSLGFPILGHHSDQSLQAPFFLSLLVGIGAACFAGYLVSLTTLRLREDYLAIVTIAVGEILRLMLLHEDWLAPLGKRKSMGGFRGLRMENPFIAGFDPFHFEIFGLSIQSGLEILSFGGKDYFLPYLLLVWIIVVLCLVFVQILVNSPYGRVMRSLREDEVAAESLGKNTFKIKTQVFVIGSGLAGLSGGLYGYYIGFVSPESFLPIITFNVWIMMIIGGKGNNYAAVLGAALITFLERSARLLKKWQGDILPQLDPLYKFGPSRDQIVLVLPADFLVLGLIAGLFAIGLFSIYRFLKERKNLSKVKETCLLAIGGLMSAAATLAVIFQMRLDMRLVFTNLGDTASSISFLNIFTLPISFLDILILSVLIIALSYLGGLQRLERVHPWIKPALRAIVFLPVILFVIFIIWNMETNGELELFSNRQRTIYLALLVSTAPLVILGILYPGLKRSSPIIFRHLRTSLLVLWGLAAAWLAVCIALMLPIEPYNFRLMLTGALLILFIMFRPQGLIPEKPLSVPYEDMGVSS